MKIGARECRAESLDTIQGCQEGLSGKIIPEQSLNQEKENPGDLGSEPGRGKSTCKGPGVGMSLMSVRNSKEASVTAAGNKAKKVKEPDLMGPSGSCMVRGAFAELEVLHWCGRYQGPCSPR